MSQLIFRFPFKATYYKKDFYVSSNNFSAYRLLENWPDWPDKLINIHGFRGCGKTHLINILKKKTNIHIFDANEINDTILEKIKDTKGLIIDNFKNNIAENLFYSLINQVKQDDQYIVINSLKPIKQSNIQLIDLKSRLESFINISINLPTDDLLRVILTKTFSDKQITVNIKFLEYILKNIDRSYEKIFKFVKDIDNESLSSGKSININLIKKVLNK